MWLDQLGLGSAFGLNMIIREAFWTGTNSIINVKNYEPRPDYWNSWFFKNLVGNKVLYVDGQFDKGRYIRCYAFCTRTKKMGSVYDYKLGDVTVVILNLYNSTQNVKIDMDIEGNVDEMKYNEFHLSGENGDILSDGIYLNGEIIEMVNDTTFPKLKPIVRGYGENNITMQALSYSFIVVENANISVCMESTKQIR